MFRQYKPILISLSPNTEKDDILLALGLLFQPWRWKSPTLNTQKSRTLKLEENFKKYLGIKHAFSFNSGRTAWLAILENISLEKGNEVLLQAFTCNAVVNPICWTGFKPVFVDIDEKTLNMDSVDLERKISPASRAESPESPRGIVLVQHTFGLSADVEKIVDICQKHNLILIEDCAHALGASRFDLNDPSRSNLIGTFGKAAFFSFGRDKVISSVFGGMAITNDDALAKKIGEWRDKLSQPSYFWIFQQLLHPILTNFLIIPLYGFFGMGKWVLLLFQKTGILSKAVSSQEKQGVMPDNFAKKIPSALAVLALNQFKKLEKIIAHQREIAEFYNKSLAGLAELTLPLESPGRIYLRYSVLVKTRDTNKILEEARRANIFLDDGWRKTVIVPPDTDQEKMGYTPGSCPIAEKTAKMILNLPTHINISKEDTQRIVKIISQHYSKFDFKNKVAKIGGWLTKDEGNFLYETVKTIAPLESIIEIGSWKGRSTICLAQGVKDSKLSSKIYAIDPHKGSSEHIKMFGKVDTYGEFIKNIQEANVNDFIVPIKDTSENASKIINDKIGFVFVDGAHEYKYVRQDFNLWFPKLANGGLVSIHDSWHQPGVLRLIAEILIFKKIKNPRLIDTLTVFEKTTKNYPQDRLKNLAFLFYLILFGWIGTVKMNYFGGKIV